MNIAQPIMIREVSPRDGLQFEKIPLSVEDRLRFIEQLAKAGARHIEVGSFVRGDKVPSMADSDKLAMILKKQVESGAYEGVVFAFLALNQKGAENALAIIDENFGELATVVAASDAFCKANMGVESCAQAFDQLVAPVMALAKDKNVRVRGYISTVFEGQQGEAIDPSIVAQAAKRYLDMGVYEVSLGDTTGAGTPDKVAALIDALQAENLPLHKIAMHFHDTHDNAIENAHEAMRRGISILDASAGGLGGCPFARSPKGNLATENLVALCSDNGIETGINMEHLVRAAHFALKKVQKQSPSQLHNQVASRLGLDDENTAETCQSA
jgi:hydroxymethylglutaryl-CoA lyase